MMHFEKELSIKRFLAEELLSRVFKVAKTAWFMLITPYTFFSQVLRGVDAQTVRWPLEKLWEKFSETESERTPLTPLGWLALSMLLFLMNSTSFSEGGESNREWIARCLFAFLGLIYWILLGPIAERIIDPQEKAGKRFHWFSMYALGSACLLTAVGQKWPLNIVNPVGWYFILTYWFTLVKVFHKILNQTPGETLLRTIIVSVLFYFCIIQGAWGLASLLGIRLIFAIAKMRKRTSQLGSH